MPDSRAMEDFIMSWIDMKPYFLVRAKEIIKEARKDLLPDDAEVRDFDIDTMGHLVIKWSSALTGTVAILSVPYSEFCRSWKSWLSDHVSSIPEARERRSNRRADELQAKELAELKRLQEKYPDANF